MKYLVLAFLAIFTSSSFSQSWTFVGTESFSPSECTSVKLANNGPALTVVTDPYSTTAFSKYLLSYQFDAGSWSVYMDTIFHPVFSTYELAPDIDMNSSNQHYILCFAGPNKSYLYESNLGLQQWDLVDSLDVNHDDLETGYAGNMFMSAYSGIYEYVWGTGGHTDFLFPSLYSFSALTVDNSFNPIAFHATNANAYEVNSHNGISYNELDSINYGQGLISYDSEMSENQPIYVHLDPTNDKILLSKYNGVDWDTVYVDAGNTYLANMIELNLAVDDSDGSIYVGVNSAVETIVPSTSTDHTIKVFKISADLATETDLGVAANFTYPGNAMMRDFDLEFSNGDIYVAYVNYEDNAKISVKTYDAASSIDNTLTAGFKMFPNPARSSVVIQSNLNNFTYEIIDLSGKTVLYNTANSNEEINVNTLQTGIYFVKIGKEGQMSATQKLVIQ